MFVVNDDMSIYLTRGDTAIFSVTADNNGKNYVFQPGDVVRMKVTEKKACENVMFQKDFPVTEEAEKVDILLTEEETKIGEVISKPTDYWYEIELNPYTNPQTIVGYDEDGAKILRLFPEGIDLEPTPIEPTDIPVVDSALSLTSDRPVQNQAIARAITGLGADIKYVRESGSERMTTIEGKIAAESSRRSEDVLRLENDIAVERARISTLVANAGNTDGNAELLDIRVGADGTNYATAGDAVRGQFTNVENDVADLKSDLGELYTTDDSVVDFKNMWEVGTLENDGTLLHSNIRIRTKDFIEIYGNKISMEYFSDSFVAELYYYDKDKNFISESQYIEGNTIITPPHTAEYIKVIAKTVPDTDYSVVGMPIVTPLRVTFANITNKNLFKGNMPKLRVTAYNVRWYMGNETLADDYSPLTAEQIEVKKKEFRSVLANHKPDIFVASEDFREYFDQEINGSGGAKTVSVYEEVYKHYFPYKSERGNSAPVIYSKYPILESGFIDVDYGSVSDYRKPVYIKINLNGYEVYVVGVHPSSGASDYYTHRIPYHAAIMTAMGSKNHVILAGDFNHDTANPVDELSSYYSNQYESGNLGYFGDKETYAGGGPKMLDNILAKGFTINDFVVGEEHYSDHYPITSELNIRI